jgi:hypothetical protein
MVCGYGSMRPVCCQCVFVKESQVSWHTNAFDKPTTLLACDSPTTTAVRDGRLARAYDACDRLYQVVDCFSPIRTQ